MEVYRGKAKEYARLTILTKSLRESRRYRKLAEMYWALALGEKPESVQPSKMIVKTSPTLLRQSFPDDVAPSPFVDFLAQPEHSGSPLGRRINSRTAAALLEMRFLKRKSSTASNSSGLSMI
jgi:hypothetical protein